MLPDCSREYLLKKKFLGEHTPKPPPSKLTAAPLDRQISLFMGKTQSHAWCLGVQMYRCTSAYECTGVYM